MLEQTFVMKDGTKHKLNEVLAPSDCFTFNKLDIIKLTGVQKLANFAEVVEKKFETAIQPTDGNKQQHGVNIWVGFKGNSDPDTFVRASGEASMLNTGKIDSIKTTDGKTQRIYNEADHIDSKFRFAMADKRAYCRAVLKLLQITDMYSEIESPDFLGASNNHDY